MQEFAVSIRSNIKESIKESMNAKAEENRMNLTPNSQPELITQDTPQPSPRVEELNSLIDEMDIKKTLNKREAPTPSNETEIQNQETQGTAYDSTSESATKP